MYCYTSACLKGRLFCATCFIFSRLSPSLKDLFTFSSPLSPLLTPQPSFISIWLLQLLGIPHWAPPPQNNIAPLYNQLVPIRTDGRTDRHVSIPERLTKIQWRPQLVRILHCYTLLTNLQYRNLYVEAVTRMFIAISTNSIQSIFSHHVLPSSVISSIILLHRSRLRYVLSNGNFEPKLCMHLLFPVPRAAQQ